MEENKKQLNELGPPVNAMPIDQPSGLLPDGSVDKEGAMAKADLFKLSNYSYKLFKKLEDEQQLESWVQAKITKAADYIASVYHYLEYEMKFSEYGAKLENSDVYSESQKAELRNKLSEAKDTIRALKIAQAEKLAESKSSKSKKEHTKDKDSEDEDDIRSKYDSDEDFYYDYPEAMPDSYARPHERVAESGTSKKAVLVSKKAKTITKPNKVSTKNTKQCDGKNAAATTMWKNIKESIEHSFGEGIYSTETQQTEDLGGNIEKFPPVNPENIKAGRMASQGYPDLVQAEKSVEQTIAGLQKTHPKLYDYIQKNPALIDKIKSKPSVFLDLLTNPIFQPTDEDQSADREFSAKNVGTAVGNVVQGVKNTADAVSGAYDSTKDAISGAYDSAKTAVSDFEKGYDSATKQPAPKKTQKVNEEEYWDFTTLSELVDIKKLSGL